MVAVQRATCIGKSRNFGSGKKIIAPPRLKNRWQSAMAMADSDRPMAAINAVIVVPTLAPIMYGNIFLGEIFWVEANNTDSEVVTEEE